MKLTKILLISFLVSLTMWMLFSWPLPRYIRHAIPSSSQNIEKYQMRAMIPGDQLQLYYQFWLVSEMITGRTPWLHNVYEFNTGDDSVRYRPGAYYAPFSLFAAIFSWIGGREFGWNSTAFISIWLIYLCTWLLARRYTVNEYIAAGSALISVGLPFLWVNLLGGSPAGFSMAWVPLMFLGIDMAARDNRITGGILAGIALLFLRWGDAHLFFFSVLAAPCWFCLVMMNNPVFKWSDIAHYKKLFLALLPIAIMFGITLVYHFHKNLHVDLSKSVGTRPLSEIALFSPPANGLVAWHAGGITSHIFIGFTIIIIIVAGLLCFFFSQSKMSSETKIIRLMFVCLILGITGIILLALATRGPFDGHIFGAVRKLIPQYKMIRQPAKIFCLMPCLLSITCAMAMTHIYILLQNRKFLRMIISLVIFAALIIELKAQVRPTLCLLHDKQNAYQAISEDARNTLKNNEEYRPAALVLPIWPGDSHFASIYEHYASLYRIRLINGYSPVVPEKYVKTVFRALESANQGILNNLQMNDLLYRFKIKYIVLHEDLFPEKVSPFPVGLTLQNLLNHPRLKLIGKDGSAWSFKILEEPSQHEKKLDFMISLFPTRRWELELCTNQNVIAEQSTDASGNTYLSLSVTNSWVETAPVKLGPVTNPKWLIRTRGTGILKVITSTSLNVLDNNTLSISATDWTWKDIPFQSSTNFGPVTLRLVLESGAINADMAIITGGERKQVAPGEKMEIPAVCFFHAGYTSKDLSSVKLRKTDEPVAAAFYGPKLPLEKGRYEVEFICSSSAPTGIELGKLNMRRTDAEDKDWTPVIAGQSAKLSYIQNLNLPVNILFLFSRNADVEIRKVIITRME
ncbi:MAG: hypothetical protein PHR77_06385 [Kiritimatiellae bacterium]|nr:hypothetical protein [Kiritimatiellia bacterium]MDD5522662.1 hypothetical protein [Kiritimatiellia bacterium]